MSDPEKQPSFVFGGFESPNTTQVPDAFFDVVAPELSEAELRVALYIIRRTFGFKKDSDNISLRQMVDGITTKNGRVLDRGTGLRKSAVANALNGLERKGIILSRRNCSRERGNEPTTYALNIKNHPLSVTVDKGLSIHADKPLSVPVDTQYTERQETVLQETEYSNSFELPTQESKNGTTFRNSKKGDKINRDRSRGLAEHQRSGKRTGGPKLIGELLETHQPLITVTTASQEPSQPRKRGRPPTYPATPAIEALMTQWTDELHDDPDHARSNVSQAARLWHEGQVSEDTFVNLMHEARTRTKQAGNIDKLADGEAGEFGFRNKIPYYFACLKQLLRNDLQRQVQDRAPTDGKGKSSNKKGDRTTDVAYG